MSAKKTLEQLEQACRELGIRLMYDDLKSEGGLCRLRDSFYLVVNRRASAETRIRMMKDAVARVTAAQARMAKVEAAVKEVPQPEAPVPEPAARGPEVGARTPESRQQEPEPSSEEEHAPEPVGAGVGSES